MLEEFICPPTRWCGINPSIVAVGDEFIKLLYGFEIQSDAIGDPVVRRNVSECKGKGTRDNPDKKQKLNENC